MTRVLVPVMLLLGLAGGARAGSGDPALSFPIHMSIQVSVPDNAASSMIGVMGGTVEVSPDGTVSGEGTIAYAHIDPCFAIPPHPDDGPSPYCELTGVTDGSFTISGEVSAWTGRGDAVDQAIMASLEQWSTDSDRPPRTLKLGFALETTPMEHMNLWGYKRGKFPARTGGLAVALGEAGVFDAPFEVSPIITDADTPPEIADAATQRYLGETGLASFDGTVFFVDKELSYVTAGSDEADFIETE